MLAPANLDDDHPLDPFQAAMASRDSDVLTLVHDALAAGRTKMAYQPIMLVGERAGVAFYEGLVRVLDEAGRVIPAAYFMSAIGENDLGREVDCTTLEHAFRLLRSRKDLRISINVSARSLADGKWRDILARGLADPSDVGNRLIFEISETSAMELHEVMIRFMVEMQPKGVAFALDGFGAGMTAFRHLKEFFFDLVKIDKSFVRGIHDDPDNQVLTEALMMVAHQFEMFVVADGVETAQEAAFMSDLGADCLQGYHLGVPKFDI
jgi:EAL domain-containing protein (putative c-di-GMP-specific phosphodiesterase class I)